MNKAQINAIRVKAGLEALPTVDNAAQKKRQAANAAQRAADSRALKALRGNGKKAK